jgi:hypothetical protein
MAQSRTLASAGTAARFRQFPHTQFPDISLLIPLGAFDQTVYNFRHDGLVKKSGDRLNVAVEHLATNHELRFTPSTGLNQSSATNCDT